VTANDAEETLLRIDVLQNAMIELRGH